jgi:hypothetical protein
MLPSLHDDFLVSYEVSCETRQIKVRAKRDPRRPPARNEERTDHVIVFNGVEGYQFENDAFGNIIFSLELIPVAQLLATSGARIAESFRMVGAPPWAADLASAAELLAEKGTQGFVLSSSYGLSGWILAREAFVERI